MLSSSSLRGIARIVCSEHLKTSVPIVYVPARNVWGNVNGPTPRGKFRPNKHKDPHYSKARANKVMKIDLPDTDFQRRMDKQDVSPAEIKEFMKRKGILPSPPYQEAPIYISCSGGYFEEFVPPEGDGRASLMSQEGAKQTAAGVQKKGKSYMAVRKIRKYEDDFDPRSFAEQAQDIYIKANVALANQNEEDLHKLVTEKAFPEMMHNVRRKTVHWGFIKSLEPPRVVQVRTQDMLTSNNLFGQVTVRFNTQQTLAVYDRFGRLIHGSEKIAKDVLEYVVFEKHLANVYGVWRLHGKLIPTWQADKPAGRLTHVLKEKKAEPDDAESGVRQEEERSDAPEAKEEESKEDLGATPVYDRFGRIIKQPQSS